MKGLWPILLLGGWWLIKQLVAKGSAASSQQAHQTWLEGVKKDLATARSQQPAANTPPATPAAAAAPGRAQALRTRPTQRRPVAAVAKPTQLPPIEESPHATEACDLLDEPINARATPPAPGERRRSLWSHMRDRTSLKRAVIMAELLERPVSLR